MTLSGQRENRDKILEKWEKEFGQKAEPKK